MGVDVSPHWSAGNRAGKKKERAFVLVKDEEGGAIFWRKFQEVLSMPL